MREQYGEKVTLSGSKRRLDSSNYDQILNLTTGNSTTITITPPLGEIWRIKNLYINIPAPVGGTAGTHYVLVHGYGGSPIKNSLLYASSNYGDAIQIRYNTILSATAAAGKNPTTEQAQQAAILGLSITNAEPLKLYYNNGATGGLQSATINITVDREVETIV
jgi:hypothetical protein